MLTIGDVERLGIERAAEAPLCGMEVVEVSPPYDSGDITSLLACRSILDVLVAEGKLGRRAR